MQRSVINRNTMKTDDPSTRNGGGIVSTPSKQEYKDEPNYCPIRQPQHQSQPQYSQSNEREVQQLLRELDMLNNRKNQIYERLKQLGFRPNN